MSSVQPPYQLYGVAASAVSLVTPRLKRITVNAGIVPGLSTDLPSQWVKIFVCDEGENRRPGRAYTVRRFDPTCGDIDLDFVLHGNDGVISKWASNAQVGDRFEISAPHSRSGIRIEPGSRRYLLVADETGLPAVAAILDALGAESHASVVLEVDDEREEQALTSNADLDIRWIHRDCAAPRALERFVAAMDVTAFDVIWVTAEATQVAAVRTVFKARGVWRKARIHASGYWKSGVSDHRDDD